jgi:hypothetical protein
MRTTPIHDMILNRGATALIAIGAGKIKQGRSDEVGEIRLDEFIQKFKSHQTAGCPS